VRVTRGEYRAQVARAREEFDRIRKVLDEQRLIRRAEHAQLPAPRSRLLDDETSDAALEAPEDNEFGFHHEVPTGAGEGFERIRIPASPQEAGATVRTRTGHQLRLPNDYALTGQATCAQC